MHITLIYIDYPYNIRSNLFLEDVEMPWINDIMSVITGKKQDIGAIKNKLQDPNVVVSDGELSAYISDINSRIKKMVKDLKNMYGRYGVTFNGFKALDLACDSLRESLKDGREEAYNNLIKLESSITTEQKRHLALIRIAMTKEGKRVIDMINSDPNQKEVFVKIFGERDVAGKSDIDGLYQRLWSEIHKLSEYILIQKNKVYH